VTLEGLNAKLASGHETDMVKGKTDSSQIGTSILQVQLLAS
jgi:hypothetical protein